MNVLRLMILVMIAVSCMSCSFIRFERGPYVVRDVEVVYSAQEDISFFFWKLPQDAVLRKVDFELLIDQDYQPIDLDQAPFAADPTKCGEFFCFQFQTAGDYQAHEELPPIRSDHKRWGTFAGTAAKFDRVITSLAIDPIGIDNNREVDPHLYDWFQEEGYVFSRAFEFALTEVDSQECAEASDWTGMGNTIPSPDAWADNENGSCLQVRPVHRDDEGLILKRSFIPSAETVSEEQRYTPPVDLAPVVYGLLLDLEIPNTGRCAQVKDFLINTIETSFQARSEEYTRLGVYTPLSSETGGELSGCEQENTQDYPVERMIEDAKTAELQYAPRPVRVVWIYVNNIDIPPSERTAMQLLQLAEDFAVETNLELFLFGIGSNVIINNGVFPWDATTGWRPIEDATFRADLVAFGRQNLPFHTRLHDDNTEVAIQKIDDAKDHIRLKVCQATPVEIEGVGVTSGFNVAPRDTPSIPWPMETLPFYRVILEPQYLVPKDAYIRRRIDLVVEVCERYCNNPFQTRGGERFFNWSNERKCQWAN